MRDRRVTSKGCSAMRRNWNLMLMHCLPLAALSGCVSPDDDESASSPGSLVSQRDKPPLGPEQPSLPVVSGLTDAPEGSIQTGIVLNVPPYEDLNYWLTYTSDDSLTPPKLHTRLSGALG